MPLTNGCIYCIAYNNNIFSTATPPPLAGEISYCAASSTITVAV